MSDPSKGAVSYTYTGFGELQSTTDARGNVIAHEYDFNGRLVRRTDNNAGGQPTAVSRWIYDTRPYGFGQPGVIGDSHSGYEQVFTYDDLGRRHIVKTTIAGHNNQLEAHYERTVYDTFGRIEQIYDAARSGEDWGQNGIQYSYNSYGYRSQLSDVITGQHYYTVLSLDPRGNVVDAEYGDGVVQSTHTYNAASGLLDSQAAMSTATAILGQRLQDRTYTWDTFGNLSARRIDGLRKNGGLHVQRNLLESFDYDTINRLTRHTVTGDGTHSVTVDYHNNGNIRSKSDVAGVYVYNSARPFALSHAGGQSYSYDNNGNLIADGTGRTFTYTPFDKVESISKGGRSTAFFYGPQRHRYKRVDSGGDGTTTTLYLNGVEKLYYPDGQRQWKRSLDGVAIITQTVTAAGGITDSTLQYLLYDHLGSISHIVSADGLLVENLDFDPWGKRRQIPDLQPLSAAAIAATYFKAAKPVTSRGFTGHEMVDEMAVIHMNGRIYDPRLGRFIQADPLIQAPYLTQSFNRYSYVMNNPLNAVDPSGFVSESMMEELTVTGREFSFDFGANLSSGVAIGLIQINFQNWDSMAGETVYRSAVFAVNMQTGEVTRNGKVVSGKVAKAAKAGLAQGLGVVLSLYAVPADSSEAGRYAKGSNVGNEGFGAFLIGMGRQFLKDTLVSAHAYATGLSPEDIGDPMGLTPGDGAQAAGAQAYEENALIIGLATVVIPGRQQQSLRTLTEATKGAKPPNLSPPGAGRNGAFREAKRQSGVPVSQQPSRVLQNVDKRGKPQPGKIYEFEVPANGGGTKTVRIRDDAGGHDFGKGNSQNRGPHFNDEAGNHFDY